MSQRSSLDSNHALEFSRLRRPVQELGLGVLLLHNNTVIVDIGTYDGLGGLLLAHRAVSLGELALGNATIGIGSLDHLDVGGAKTEFDFTASTELLSILEEALEKRAFLEEYTSAVELSLAVELTDVGSLEAVLVDLNG